MHVVFQNSIPAHAWEMGSCWSYVLESEAKYRPRTGTGSEDNNDCHLSNAPKPAWVEGKESFKLSDVPSTQMKKDENNNTQAKSKKVKVLPEKSKEERRRSTAAQINYRPRYRWGGSVASYFHTTNRKVDIDESLTYGARRATVPAKIVKSEIKKNEETGEVFWEDNVKPLSGKLPENKDRRMSQDWKAMKRKVRSSSLSSQTRRIDKD